MFAEQRISPKQYSTGLIPRQTRGLPRSPHGIVVAPGHVMMPAWMRGQYDFAQLLRTAAKSATTPGPRCSYVALWSDHAATVGFTTVPRRRGFKGLNGQCPAAGSVKLYHGWRRSWYHQPTRQHNVVEMVWQTPQEPQTVPPSRIRAVGQLDELVAATS